MRRLCAPSPSAPNKRATEKNVRPRCHRRLQSAASVREESQLARRRSEAGVFIFTLDTVVCAMGDFFFRAVTAVYEAGDFLFTLDTVVYEVW